MDRKSHLKTVRESVQLGVKTIHVMDEDETEQNTANGEKKKRREKRPFQLLEGSRSGNTE